jgi:hypothetical protein
VASFFKSLFIFTAVLVVLLFVLAKSTEYINNATWFILGYFVFITAGFHYGLTMASKGKPQQFVRYYMGATSFKLLFHLAVLIIYCLFHRDEAVRFIIAFALFYFAFTVFEFSAVRKSLKK